MNKEKSLKFSGNGWVTVVDCHLCKLQIPAKEAYITSVDCEYFGAKGSILVSVCKECSREEKLNDLGI